MASSTVTISGQPGPFFPTWCGRWLLRPVCRAARCLCGQGDLDDGTVSQLLEELAGEMDRPSDTTTSEEHENHNDNQNGCHSFFPKCTSGELPSCIWVRNNCVTSLGIYLVLRIASGWFVATLCSPPRSSGNDRERRVLHARIPDARIHRIQNGKFHNWNAWRPPLGVIRDFGQLV